MERRALISADGAYRYKLSRTWQPWAPSAFFILLNPSTADAEIDDPTVRRCVSFAKSFGCGSVKLGNLFALRATSPKELFKTFDPVGPENDEHIRKDAHAADFIILAWGIWGPYMDRDSEVRAALRRYGIWNRCHTLGVTKEGYPRHPLYLPATTMLQCATPTRE